ncbi:23S rRNA (guanosine(2251)-2'-O)-methyltransferase RlmB [Ghiorsea bivora]|uniref:23S rRNA (guanosine(2251)-2'-O)-methyltransferase RlmB n=1 Tax=Ghiorsea bivora TaxID=1485545 RepID=UPI0005707CDF|nr:23S rRNA (guanosine(2251)-2'-O)-methyltransferase RlmB [Ghiorsea bivora]
MSRIAGIHAVKHALDAGETIDELVVLKGKTHPRLNELIHLARKAKVRVSFAPKEALERLAEGVPHQGVVAKMAAKGAVNFKDWLQQVSKQDEALVLILDQVTDPHNLGACIRTAEASGCAGVVIPKDHAADLHSPIVSKSACGALARIPVLSVTNLARTMKELQQAGFWISGLAGEADTLIHDINFSGKNALVMGAEGEGMRRLVRETCDQLVKIPMPGKVESLNVSVATGVALFEVVRQGLK